LGKVLQVSIIISDISHPVFEVVSTWIKSHPDYDIELVTSIVELRKNGDFLFLISCSEIVNQEVRSRFKHTLVLHASDLPKGRGWSPHVWDVLSGADKLTLCLLEAEDKVDTGRIWKKVHIPLDGTELFDEINKKLFLAEISLLEYALDNWQFITPSEQNLDETPFYYPKRTPADSELDPDRSLRDQFNLLRVCDNERFPAFVTLSGQKYSVTLKKI
jgi:methionyl-tRNA formyltransferase